MLTRVWLLVAVVVAAALTGCSDPPARPPTAPRPGIELSAALVSGLNVRLTWRDTGPEAAGYLPEYATAPGGPFTILGFLPPGQHVYWHPNLIPDTTFYYRVVPYYGPASPPVQVNLPPGAYGNRANANDQVWAKPQTIPGPPVVKRSIRHPDTAAAGAPTGLRATVMNPNAIRFTWTDHASDAQGYLKMFR